MNRRKFLGLTIGGVAAGAREFPLANSQSTETQSPSSAPRSIHISDREKAGLRGPVRTCVEETIHPFSGNSLTATEYSPDGRLLTTRTVQSDGSQWVTSQTYDADGRLAKTVSGKLGATILAGGEPGTESLYAYDEAGRLSTRSNEYGGRVYFHYCDKQGRKTTIQKSAAVVERYQPRVGNIGSSWDAALAGMGGVLPGGSVTTVYDDRGQQAELQIRDAEGQLMSGIARTYNANGQVSEERAIATGETEVMLPRNTRNKDQLTPEQIERLRKETSETSGGMSYTYDTQGRITSVSISFTGIIEDTVTTQERTTTVIYNDHDDITEERNEWTEYPSGDKHDDARPEIRYVYQYDSYGNWTEQTVIEVYRPNLYIVHHRTLTYC